MKPTRPLKVRAWVERTCDSPDGGVAEFTGQTRRECRLCCEQGAPARPKTVHDRKVRRSYKEVPKKKLRAGSEQKLQVHKVREGSAVGSSGELPWGRTLMCARFKAAVEAAARQCSVYRRLPRDRRLRSALGAGQGASAAWHATFQREVARRSTHPN